MNYSTEDAGTTDYLFGGGKKDELESHVISDTKKLQSIEGFKMQAMAYKSKKRNKCLYETAAFQGLLKCRCIKLKGPVFSLRGLQVFLYVIFLFSLVIVNTHIQTYNVLYVLS